MAITFYDDILSPKLVLDGASTSFQASISAGVLTEQTDYVLPLSLPSSNGKVLSTTSEGVMSWVDAPSPEYIASMGENMVTNGSGLLASNFNFPAFTFSGSVTNLSPGSFTYENELGSTTTTEYMPVNVSKRYKMSADMKSLHGVGKYFMGTWQYDIDDKLVNSKHHMFLEGTLTTLAEDLVYGATEIKLTDASNWDGTLTERHERQIIFWNYSNSHGYLYPVGTYSRNLSNTVVTLPADEGWAYDGAWDVGGIDNYSNTITIAESAPGVAGTWRGLETIPAGTFVSQADASGTYKYNVAAGVIVPNNKFTTYTGYMDGVDYSGKNVRTKFSPGTAKIRIGWLLNYRSAADEAADASWVADDTIWITNVFAGLDYVAGTGRFKYFSDYVELTNAEIPDLVSDGATLNDALYQSVGKELEVVRGVKYLNNENFYKVRQSVEGTGTEAGGSWLVYYDGGTNTWITREIGTNGTASNHPLLIIKLDGSGAKLLAWNRHGTTSYKNYYSVETFCTQSNTGFPTPHSVGSDFHWQRATDKLYYLDGNVGFNTNNPTEVIDVLGNVNATGYKVGGNVLVLDDDTLGGGASSDTQVPTQQSVKQYIDGVVLGGVQVDATKVADGSVTNTEFQYINSVTSNVQYQINSTVSATTANATAISLLQDALDPTGPSGGGGKGVYAKNTKSTSFSYLGMADTSLRMQAGGNTAVNMTESSPGEITMIVQAGSTGSEIPVTAITIEGNDSFQNAITTFNQRAVFDMRADFNSAVDLNGNATGISTNQVTEGTNLYYTDARARAAITLTDTGGLGSLQFSGGTLTYTGPSDAEIHASYEFGTNIHVTDVVDSGTGRAVKQIAATYDNTEVQTYLSGGSATTIETSGDVTVGGNLIVSGTQTQLNTTTLEVEDINIVVGKLATTSTLTNGAGLTFGAWSSGTIPTLTWDHANTRLSSNKNFYAPIIKTGNIQLDNGSNPVLISSDESIYFQVDGEDSLEARSTGIAVSGDITLSGTVDGIDIATDVAANTAKTGITSAQAAEITANTAKTGITSGQASAITANTAKVSNVSTTLTVVRSNSSFRINSDGGAQGTAYLPVATTSLWGAMSDEMVVALNANTAKTSFPGLGTTSTTALAGDTSLLALGTSSTTALAGDTTTISSAQASAITANTAKISYSTAASDAVALNTAKTGITSSQASEITANTAKVSNIVQTTITGNAGTATQLAQTVTIGGEDFDGDQSIDLPGVNETGNQDTTGNAATATTLATARNIGGVSFNGSAAITLPGVDAAGTQDTSGNAATATKIASITNTDIVQLAGAQTLSGVKTFSSSIVSPGITSASNGNIVIDPDGTGSITLRSDNIIFEGAGTMTLPSLKLSEATLLEGNYVGFGPPLSITANTIWTLPDGDGTVGQVMKTSGAGVLSWTSVLDGVNDTLTGTISVKPVGGIDGRIAFYEDGSTNYVLLQANNSLATNYTLYLPTADGSADQVLKTDGSGNLGWSTPSSGGGAVDMPLMTLGGRVQHSTTYDNRMIICGGTYGPTYYIWSSPAGVTTSGGGTVDSTTFTLSTSYQHYGAIRVPTAGQIKVDFLAKPLNSSSYSKPYVLQVWEFTPAIDTSTGPTCTLRGKVDMTSSDSTSKAVSATITTTSDVAAGSYIFVTIGMDAQTLTTTAYQYMNINLSILA